MLKIVTGTVFVILEATSAFCEEPAPAPSSPPVLAQSSPAGVIEATTLLHSRQRCRRGAQAQRLR